MNFLQVEARDVRSHCFVLRTWISQAPFHYMSFRILSGSRPFSLAVSSRNSIR